MTKITSQERSRIVTLIATHTDFDPATVRFSRDGDVSAKMDPDKVPGCHAARVMVARAECFENGANPFVG